jgi:hypothetical protein
MKQKKITPTMQRLAQEVAADILTEFTFIRNMDDVHEAYNRVFERYGLCYDPFTYTPCSPDEYDENREEWDRQMMEMRYGYGDL